MLSRGRGQRGLESFVVETEHAATFLLRNARRRSLDGVHCCWAVLEEITACEIMRQVGSRRFEDAFQMLRIELGCLPFRMPVRFYVPFFNERKIPMTDLTRASQELYRRHHQTNGSDRFANWPSIASRRSNSPVIAGSCPSRSRPESVMARSRWTSKGLTIRSI